MDVSPICLEGKYVRLEPLSLTHCDGLVEAARDGALWELRIAGIPTPDQMADWVERSVQAQEKCRQLSFSIHWQPTSAIVGTTSFLYIDTRNRKLEIGRTWLARSWQGTPVNTEAKFLMLQHAFEVWNCIRVQFITNVLNERARAAILRIGGKEEGVLRHHKLNQDGSYRDSVYYSIVNTEWPDVKAALLEKLQRPYRAR